MKYSTQMHLFIFLLAAGFSSAAGASSPGMIEGPPGCTWNATVTNAGAEGEVRLDTMHGACMYEPQSCGLAGDILSIKADGAHEIKKDAELQVWVDTDANGKLKASLTQPVCTREPITH